MLRSLVTASGLSHESIKELASTPCVKNNKTPDQLAANDMMREILFGLKTKGYHGPIYQSGNKSTEGSSRKQSVRNKD